MPDSLTTTLSRRQALARLGLGAAALYAAPALLPLNRAAAASVSEPSVSEPSVSEPSEPSAPSEPSVASLPSEPSVPDDPVDPLLKPMPA